MVMQHLYSNHPNQGSNYIKHTYGISMIKRVGETCLRTHWAQLRHQWGPPGDEAPPQKSVLQYATYKQAMAYFSTGSAHAIQEKNRAAPSTL
jgi:hypothetical protein